MIKSKNLLIGLMSILIFSYGYAQPLEPPCHKKEGFCEEGLERINLTLEQKNRMEDIRSETRKIIIPLRAQIELKEIDLRKELDREKPDKDKIMKLAREIHDLNWEIEKAHIEERLKIRSILTHEQLEKLRTPRHIHKDLICPKHRHLKE